MPNLSYWTIRTATLIESEDGTSFSSVDAEYINAAIFDNFNLGVELCIFSRRCLCKSTLRHLKDRSDFKNLNCNNNNAVLTNKNNNRPQVLPNIFVTRQKFSDRDKPKSSYVSAKTAGKNATVETNTCALERPRSTTKRPRTGLTKWWECTNEHKAFCMKVREKEMAELKAKQQLAVSYRWRHKAKSADKSTGQLAIKPALELEVSHEAGEPYKKLSPESLMSLVESRLYNGYYFDQPNKARLEITPKEYDDCTPSGIPFFGDLKNRLVYVKKQGWHTKVNLRPAPPDENRKIWPFEREDAEKVVYNDDNNITTCPQRMYVARYYDRHSVCYGHRNLPKAYVCSRAPRHNGKPQPRSRMRCRRCGQAVPTAELFGFKNVWPTLERPYVCTCELSIYSQERLAQRKHRDIPIFNVLEHPAAEVLDEIEKQELDISTRVKRGTIPHFSNVVSHARVNPRSSSNKSDGEQLETSDKPSAEEQAVARLEYCGTCRRTCYQPSIVHGAAHHYGTLERATPDPTIQHDFVFEDTHGTTEFCRPPSSKKSPRKTPPGRAGFVDKSSQTDLLPPIQGESCRCGRPPSAFIQNVRNFTEIGQFGERVEDLVESGQKIGFGICATKLMDLGRQIASRDESVCPICFLRARQIKKPEVASTDAEKTREIPKAQLDKIVEEDYEETAELDEAVTAQPEKSVEAQEELTRESYEEATDHFHPQVQHTVGAIMEKLQNAEEMKQLATRKRPPGEDHDHHHQRTKHVQDTTQSILTKKADLHQRHQTGEDVKSSDAMTQAAARAKYGTQVQHTWKKRPLGLPTTAFLHHVPSPVESEEEFDLVIRPSDFFLMHPAESEKVMKAVQGADLGFYEIWETFTHMTGAKKETYELHAPITVDETEHKEHFMAAWKDYTESTDVMKDMLVIVPLQQIATNDNVIEATMDFYISFLKFLHYAWNPPGTERIAEVDILSTIDPEKAVAFLRMFREAPKIYEDSLYRGDHARTKEEIDLDRRWKDFVHTLYPSGKTHELIGGPFDPSRQIELFEEFRQFLHIHTLTNAAENASQATLIEFSTWLAFMQGVWGDGKITPVQHFDKMQQEQEKIVHLWKQHRTELKKIQRSGTEEQKQGLPLVDWFLSKDENVKHLNGAIKNMENLRDEVEERRIKETNETATKQSSHEAIQTTEQPTTAVSRSARSAAQSKVVAYMTNFQIPIRYSPDVLPQIEAGISSNLSEAQLDDSYRYNFQMREQLPPVTASLKPQGLLKGRAPFAVSKPATPLAATHRPQVEALASVQQQMAETHTGVVQDKNADTPMWDARQLKAKPHTVVVQGKNADTPMRGARQLEAEKTTVEPNVQQHTHEDISALDNQDHTMETPLRPLPIGISQYSQHELTHSESTSQEMMTASAATILQQKRARKDKHALEVPLNKASIEMVHVYNPSKEIVPVTTDAAEAHLSEPTYTEGAFIMPVHPQDVEEVNKRKKAERKRILVMRKTREPLPAIENHLPGSQDQGAPELTKGEEKPPLKLPKLQTKDRKQSTPKYVGESQLTGIATKLDTKKEQQIVLKPADEPATTSVDKPLPPIETKPTYASSTEEARARLHERHIERKKQATKKTKKSLEEDKPKEIAPAVVSKTESEKKEIAPVIIKWNEHINERKKTLGTAASVMAIESIRERTISWSPTLSSQYVLLSGSPDGVKSAAAASAAALGRHVQSSEGLLQELLQKKLMDVPQHLNLGLLAKKRRRQMGWLTASTSSGDISPVFRRSKAITIPNYNIRISLKACRFSLPHQIEMLEKMTPVEYLKNYVTPDPTRKYIFKRIFYKSNHNEKLTVEMLKEALHTCFASYITNSDVDQVISMLELAPNLKISYKLFVGCAAFAERLIFPKMAKLVIDVNKRAKYDKSHLELCDFHDFKFRTESLHISPSLKALLDIIIAPAWPGL